MAALRDECAAFRRAADAADAVGRERDELKTQLMELQGCKAQAEALQQQLTAYRSQVEDEARRVQVEQALRSALLAGGANVKALPLLMKAVDAAELALEQAEGEQPRLQQEQAVVAELQSQYADFFAQPQVLATPALAPPVGLPGALTAQELRDMAPEAINANWSTVKAALAAD